MQGVKYAVAVAEVMSATYIYPIAHNGRLVSCMDDSGYVTGMEDLPEGYDKEDTYDAIKAWAINDGYYTDPSVETGVYDYDNVIGTFIIGQRYLGQLQPIV